MIVSFPATGAAAERPAYLRIVWGAGAAAREAWHGSIEVEGGALTSFSPLGVEADEAAALQLIDGRLVIDPLHPRSFDGCDVTVAGEAGCTLVVNLSNTETAPDQSLRIELADVLANSFRSSLANGSGYLLAMRAPGDRLRVVMDRDHLVFDPDEGWSLTVIPDVEPKPGESTVPIVARIRATGGSEWIWETSQSWRPEDESLQLDLVAPPEEGAYALEIVVQERQRFAQRLLPGQSPAIRARRSVEFVVIDPEASAAPTSDQWTNELTIDPANPRWWQRLPSWTRVTRLPGMAAPEPMGNVELLTEEFPEGRLVGLPIQPPQSEPAWQAYALPVRRPGVRHAVEIQLPAGRKQDLQFCIAEPDAAGRALHFTRHAGAYCNGNARNGQAEPASRRLVFWPQTRSPVLLLANRSSQDVAYYGSIKLLSDGGSEGKAGPSAKPNPSDRLLAAYLSSADWIRALGDAGHYDTASGLAITDWNAALTAGRRLAQRVKASGYNGVVACIAADGSALTPLDAFGNSPRYDNGRLASDGSDPVRKDIVEALLRVFDREGLQLVPAIRLSAPVPALEPLLDVDHPVQTGVAWMDARGQSWREATHGERSRGFHYNLLSPEVQTQLSRAAEGLADRYAHHPSLTGIAIQMPGDGFGLLPGLQWGMDDDTVRRFAQAAGLSNELLESLDPQERSQRLTGPLESQWESWRRSEATKFYQTLARKLHGKDCPLRLVLCTEHALKSPRAQQEVRLAVAGRGSLTRAWELTGIDVPILAATPGVALLRPMSIDSESSPRQRAVDRYVNASRSVNALFQSGSEQGREADHGILLYHASRPLTLPTFNEQSPFGAGATRLSLRGSTEGAGADARANLVAAAAAGDWSVLVEGGEAWLMADAPQRQRILSILRDLPLHAAQTSNSREQPVQMRIFRAADHTDVCIVNEAPWPVRARLSWQGSNDSQIVALGVASAEPLETAVTGGVYELPVELPPYDMQAWRIADPSARMEPLRLEEDSSARDELQRRIHHLDARMQNLGIRRPFPELADASFEQSSASPERGWKVRRGSAGRVGFDAPGLAGQRALRLVSEDRLGVAAQSQPFRVPATGELVVQAAVRAEPPTANVRLHFSIEYGANGQAERKVQTIGAGQPLRDQWTVYEVAVEGLPLEETAQLQLQIHATGKGEIWVDQVELFDLEFSSDERIELTKRLFAAKTALREGKLVDCLRHVESYWTQRVVEHVPPLQIAAAPPKTPPPPEDEEEESQRWLPRLWR